MISTGPILCLIAVFGAEPSANHHLSERGVGIAVVSPRWIDRSEWESLTHCKDCGGTGVGKTLIISTKENIVMRSKTRVLAVHESFVGEGMRGGCLGNKIPATWMPS